MHVLSRGGRAAAHPAASRAGGFQAIHAFCHGKMALLLQHQASRQALLMASAKKNYQDYDKDSLDVDSIDEVDDKFGKYAEWQQTDAAAAKAARQPTNVYAQQAPASNTRPPPIFDDFGFDETWAAPGGGGGGYMNGNGGGRNGWGGYSNGAGYANSGAYTGGGYVNGNGNGGYNDPWGVDGFGGLGGLSGGGGGYGNYGSGGYVGTTTKQRGNMRYRTLGDWEDDLDEIDGEKPVVKVDQCVINGKTLLCNHGITVNEVFVLGPGSDRNPLGTMPTSRAQALADEAKEDLVLLNPEASPPVARIIKWDKYKYEQEKTAKEKKAKSTSVEIKEVRMRPSTGEGDIEVKLKSCKKFLSKGDRVKLVMKFEGREVQYKEQGKEVLLNFISELANIAKVEGPLNFKTGTYTIMLAPKTA